MAEESDSENSYIELIRINYDGPAEQKHNIFLDMSEMVVGRSPTQSTVIIPDPLISRQHVRFERDQDGKWTVTDLSLNGVLLNSRRLVSRQPTPLSVSDTLQLDQPGKYQYRAVETSDRPPPAKRALTSAEFVRRQQEKREAEAKRLELEKQREIEAKQREIEKQKELERRLQEERLMEETRLKEAAAKLQEEKEREEAMRREAEEQEARIKEEKEKLEMRLHKMQEELDEQQAQVEQAAKEREEYEKRMATLKEEVEKREQEMENEKRLREQLQQQEADLKSQLAAEVQRLERERCDIEQQLKGLSGPAAAAVLLALAQGGGARRSRSLAACLRRAARPVRRSGSAAEATGRLQSRSGPDATGRPSPDSFDQEDGDGQEAPDWASGNQDVTVQWSPLRPPSRSVTTSQTGSPSRSQSRFRSRSRSQSRSRSAHSRRSAPSDQDEIDSVEIQAAPIPAPSPTSVPDPDPAPAPAPAETNGTIGVSGGQEEYPCGVCGSETEGTACVACDGCDVWHHLACVRLSRRQRRRLDTVRWFCRRCRPSSG